MSTFIISYDLSAPGRNYDDLYEHLKTYTHWAHPMESTWLIVTDRTTTEVRDAIKAIVDDNDKVLVYDVTGKGASWRGLNATLTKWIKDNQ